MHLEDDNGGYGHYDENGEEYDEKEELEGAGAYDEEAALDGVQLPAAKPQQGEQEAEPGPDIVALEEGRGSSLGSLGPDAEEAVAAEAKAEAAAPAEEASVVVEIHVPPAAAEAAPADEEEEEVAAVAAALEGAAISPLKAAEKEVAPVPAAAASTPSTPAAAAGQPQQPTAAMESGGSCSSVSSGRKPGQVIPPLPLTPSSAFKPQQAPKPPVAQPQQPQPSPSPVFMPPPPHPSTASAAAAALHMTPASHTSTGSGSGGMGRGRSLSFHGSASGGKISSKIYMSPSGSPAQVQLLSALDDLVEHQNTITMLNAQLVYDGWGCCLVARVESIYVPALVSTTTHTREFV